MNLLKVVALVLVFAAAGSLFISHQAAAVNVLPECQSGEVASSEVCQDYSSNKRGPEPVISTIKVVISLISYAIGIVAVIIIIIAGLRMVLSAGDSQTIGVARNQIIYAAVGIVIAVLAQSLVLFVLDKLS